MFKSFNLRRKGLERILGELECAVMEQLWQHSQASVREVHEALSDRKLAYTTVMTVMGRLAEKGLLIKEKRDNAYIYQPAVNREELEQRMVSEVSDSLKDLTLPALMRFVDQLPPDADMLDKLDRMIAEKRSEISEGAN